MPDWNGGNGYNSPADRVPWPGKKGGRAGGGKRVPLGGKSSSSGCAVIVFAVVFSGAASAAGLIGSAVQLFT